MDFSVAIPNYDHKKVKVLCIYLDPSKTPIKVSILVNLGSKVSKIKEILKGHFASPPNVVIAVYYLKEIVPDSFEITDIGDHTLIAFESPKHDDSSYTLPIIITNWAIKNKTILRGPNNPEIEREFRETCSLYERDCSALNLPLSQDYQKYINNYQKMTSLYLIKEKSNKTTKLWIYDTESQNEKIRERRILDTQESLQGACVIQLPNGELFCDGRFKSSGKALIIDRNYGIRILQSGKPCLSKSCTYFNNCVYCLGYCKTNRFFLLSKFDLSENRWVNLTTTQEDGYDFSSATFNGNIVISGFCNSKSLNPLNQLGLYSIDIDSFSIIPTDIPKGGKGILINADRLYMIELGYGKIYESEDIYNWKIISNIIAQFKFPDRFPTQVYWSYNKGCIYITAQWFFENERWENNFCKFDLAKRELENGSNNYRFSKMKFTYNKNIG